MGTIIADNIRRIRASIPQGVKYVVVSKYRPLEQLQAAYDAGERIFAESRPVELSQKAAALPKDIQWHFIGHLQTNKLKLVLPYCSLIQSVDSIHLMEAMEKYCSAADISVNILMEIHIGREESKQGFTEEEAYGFFTENRWKNYPHLCFCGLMGMASHTDDRNLIEKDFSKIHAIYGKILNLYNCPPSFRELSIGMSGDYLLALKHGATMVRIGSASFE